MFRLNVSFHLTKMTYIYYLKSPRATNKAQSVININNIYLYKHLRQHKKT